MYIKQMHTHTHTHNSNSRQPNMNCITCCVRCCALSNADTLGWSCSSTLRGESLSRSKSLWLTQLSLATPPLFWSASSPFSPLLWAWMCFSEHTCSEYTCVRFFLPSVATTLPYTLTRLELCGKMSSINSTTVLSPVCEEPTLICLWKK